MSVNSTELARRYRELGGGAEIVVLKGLGHGGHELYESQPLLSSCWPTDRRLPP